MLLDVPQPFVDRTAEGDDAKRELIAAEAVPQPDDFGKLTDAASIAEKAGREIAANFRSLGPRQRRSIIIVFRRQLIPPGKPGRKRSKEITAAFADWKAGMRGLPLYRKHIRRFDRMGHWERKVKTRVLMDAIHARNRREKRRQTPVNVNPAH